MPHSNRAPRSRASSVALVILALLVVALPLARGGVDAATEATALLLAGAAALFATSAHSGIPRTALALAAVVGIIALQLLPWPAALHPLSPATRSVFETSLAPIGQYPAARSLTLDVPATARELGKAVACLAAFTAAWTFSATRRRKGRLLAAIALGAALVSATVLAAAVLGLRPLLAPTFPFVNPNHLAGFLDLTAFVALGLAVRARGQACVLWALAFAAAAAVVFSSLSRGGVAAFFVGLAVFAVRFLWHRDETPAPAPTARRIALLAAATAVALGTAAYLALGPVIREMATLDTPSEDLKVNLWPAGARVARDFPLTGIGRGAFAIAFPAYRTEPASVTFTHLENEWLQVVIDLGLPGGLLLAGTLLAIWIGAVRRRDLSPPEVGLLAGTAALAAHSLFDFSVELLGVAIPLSIALGLLSRRSAPVKLRPWVLRAALGGLVLAGAGGLAVGALHSDDGAVAIARADLGDVAPLASRSAAWRPADYVPHAAAGARLAAVGRCREALPWLLRAMTLAPGVPEPHLDAGRCLASAGSATAARREYRLAFLLGRRDALAEAAQHWHAFEDLYQVAPATSDGLLALGALLARSRPDDARRTYARALDEFEDPRALLPLAHATLAAGDREGALALARRRTKEEPFEEEGYRLAAWTLILLGREEAAREELERGIAAVPGSPRLLGLLSERMLAARRFAEARRLAEQIAARSPADVALREALAARALAGQGRLSEAIGRAASGAAALPDSPGPLLQLAQLCTDAGQLGEAIAALERAAALPRAAPGAYAGRIADLRARLASEEERRRTDALLRQDAPLLP